MSGERPEQNEVRRWRGLIEQLPLPTAVFEGPDHLVIAASLPYRSMVGGRELVGRLAREALPELVEQGFYAGLEEAYRTGRPVSAVAAPADFDADGDGIPETHFVDYTFQPLFDPDGRVWGVVVGVIDVTERQVAAQALRAGERRLQQVLNALPVGVLIADAEGRLLWQNPASRRLWGGVLEDFVQYRGWWAESGRELEPDEWGLPRALRGEESHGELIDIEGGGVRRTLLNSAATLRDEAGEIVGAVAVYEDVTETREREERRAVLAAALEGLQEGVCLTRPDGAVVYANQAFSGILGLESSPIGGRLSEAAEDVGSALEDAFAKMTSAAGWTGRVRGLRPDGREMTLEVTLGRVASPYGGQELLFGIVRDIGAQLQVERQLRQAERLASLGTLVGGVAHELNNPLSAVLGFVELMLMDERSEAERDDLQTIRREAERMAKIVADLRLIARGVPEEASAARVDLNDVIRHVLKTRAHSLKRREIELREDLAADLPAVLADRGRLEQAVLNLVVNAEQAMSGGAPPRRLIVRSRATAQGSSVHVVDNGPGIPPRHLERIFDPFFTTKSPGEGTGLGLALVHTIVTEHRGEIRVDSEVGAGTAFRIDLPRAPADGNEPVAAPEPVAGSAERPRVLVVDDETAVRRVVVRYLARLGYEADEAADGRQALSLIDWAERPYGVIISDLRMPGLSGEELLKRLAERGMADRVIFLTGDTASEDGARALEESGVTVLPKPITMEELRQALEAVSEQNR